jgi:hypothetical protein
VDRICATNASSSPARRGADDELRAFGGEQQRGGAADAGTGAGDEDDLAFETLAHGGFSGWIDDRQAWAKVRAAASESPRFLVNAA